MVALCAALVVLNERVLPRGQFHPSITLVSEFNREG